MVVAALEAAALASVGAMGLAVEIREVIKVVVVARVGVHRAAGALVAVVMAAVGTEAEVMGAEAKVEVAQVEAVPAVVLPGAKREEAVVCVARWPAALARAVG